MKSHIVNSIKKTPMFKLLRSLGLKESNLLVSKSYSKYFSEKIQSNSMRQSLQQERFDTNEDKTGVLLSFEDKPGILASITNIFAKHNVNLSYINSKPSKFLSKGKSKMIDFFIDFEGKISDSNVHNALEEVKAQAASINFHLTSEVPWFPKNILDLDSIGRELLSAGEALTSDHPGFNDEVYRKRREEIVNISNSYKITDGENIPVVEYTEQEKQTWKLLWNMLIPLQKKYACKEVLEDLDCFINELNFNENEIPQVKDVSKFLMKKTNTLFRPVGGLLTQREFLNGLAFRVFHSTQYIRHYSKPLYTPEPDIVHEILGHAILLANKDFADFSQEIGLASLGASDEDIKKLGTIYWFTIEFGILLQNNEKKIYGAGILSSPSEIEWSISEKPRYNKFDLEYIANFPFTITDIQQDYFLAPSFADMKIQVMKYAENIKKPFNLSYDLESHSIIIDRKISTRKEML